MFPPVSIMKLSLMPQFIKKIFCSLLLFISATELLSLDIRYVLKSSVTVPAGWSRKSSVSANRVIRVCIGLKQHGWETFEQHLMESMDCVIVC